MVAERFKILVDELAQQLSVKLEPDTHNACRLQFKDGLVLSMQPNSTLDTLRVVVEIATPGQGRYREAILKEALRANGLPYPHVGTFAFSPKTDMLLLCDQLPMEELSGQRLAEIIKQLSDKAREWKESIARGETPVLRGVQSARASEGVFGLK